MRGRFEALHIASGIRRVRTTSAALLTLAAVTALLTGPSPAHAATLPTGNLIANAGAEDSGKTVFRAFANISYDDVMHQYRIRAAISDIKISRAIKRES